LLTEFVLDFRYTAPFGNAGGSNASSVKIEAKFRNFDPRKIGGRVSEIHVLSKKSNFTTEPPVSI